VFAIRLLVGPVCAGTLVLPVRPGSDGNPGRLRPLAVPVSHDVLTEATALLAQVGHAGASGELAVLPRPLGSPSEVILVGIGADGEAGWRLAGSALGRQRQTAPAAVAGGSPPAGGATAGRVGAPYTLVLPPGVDAAAIRGLAEGFWLASYHYQAPGRLPGEVPAGTHDGTDGELLLVVAEADAATAAQALRTARVTAEMTWLARDLTNAPACVKNPAWLADQVSRAAAAYPGLTVSVRGPEHLAAEGFGGIVAVGSGSAHGPRLVELSWRPAGARTHVVLAGKGITFDTGGISLKPVAGMTLMRKDVGGAAAVIASVLGAAALGLPVRVTAIVPLAENMVSGSAFRPGDVIRHYGGLTSESTNSDAEGRLVLADALAYAVDRLVPDLLVDLATLTGANAIALGRRTAALYSDNDGLAADLLRAAGAAGEQAWRMPMPDDYLDYLTSTVADLYSAPDRGAGSVVAALYLREFAGTRRGHWAHLDMSAPAWAEADDGDLTRGATGWGVRTLLRWLATLGPAAA